jgi:cytochrome P450
MCMQLTAAGGYDTTSNLIASGLWVLLQHPDEYGRLTPRPVAARQRGGGAVLVGALGAGQPRPGAVSYPDRLDLGRPNSNRQLGFGHGIHFCIGARPARLTASVAFTMVMDRMPRLTPVQPRPQWRPTFVTRGLARFRSLLRTPLKDAGCDEPERTDRNRALNCLRQCREFLRQSLTGRLNGEERRVLTGTQA